LDERHDDWLYVWRKRRDVRSCCKPPHAGLFVTNVSKASPKLFLACTTGQHIKEAVLVGGVKEGKDRQEFFNVKLTDTYSQLVPARRIKR
jgi:type VI protein secretion system component Hcp